MPASRKPITEWHIYALRDPRTNGIRYVGCTAFLKRRITSHLRPSKKDRTPRAAWIKELSAIGLKPIAEILETTRGDYQAAEKKWISKCRCEGCQLTNSTDGGNGSVGYQFTDADRAKIAKAGRRPHSPEWKANAAAAHRALNRKLSDENKQILSRTHKGKYISDRQRASVSQRMKGREVSTETRAKLSAAFKGREISDETRAKLSAANIGKKQSTETRAKMKAAWDKRKSERSSFPEMRRRQAPID